MRTPVHYVRFAVLLCLFSLLFQRSSGQSITAGDGKFEIGLGLGPSFFLGDLGGQKGVGKTFVKDVNFPLTKFMKGIYLNYYPAEWLGLRLAANLGQLEAYDSIIDTKGRDEYERRKRNLSFRSKLTEAYAAVEIYPTVMFEEYEGLEHKLRPYGLVGFGYYHFNPKALYTHPDGTQSWVELKPLRLEGQGMAEYAGREEYSLHQTALLMGGGFKYYLKENMYLGFEILHRKTFTDYIDDVSTKYIDPSLFSSYLSPSQASIAQQMMFREHLVTNTTRPFINQQRGDPTENDAFFSGILRFGWRLNGANSPNGRARRQLKCPIYY
jgi:opacity protein-like surface antigen